MIVDLKSSVTRFVYVYFIYLYIVYFSIAIKVMREKDRKVVSEKNERVFQELHDYP